MTQDALNYQRIASAIAYLDAHYDQQPDLAALAEAVAVSPDHLQRLFTQWAGVSPKRFLQCLTLEHLKARLGHYANLAEAADSVGLAGANRVYDLFVQLEALSPSVFLRRGAGLELRYGTHPTPFGHVFVATSERGITDLQFYDTPTELAALEAGFAERWAAAERVEDPALAATLAAQVFGPATGAGARLKLLVGGTAFQLKVWQALVQVPEGRLVSYHDLARAIGQPQASRAVGSAVGANPIGYLIPCHRVIRTTGVVGGYRWGSTRKKLLLAYEGTKHLDSAA
ncbi:MAG: methylated-DNA--[protein]-cysteine S-methyltransferase [Bacteroidia bacterium]|nr:methylated-DNA--[protein]-cysteine S-methyltransferase [Bacteroidia bacterium]